MKVKKHWAVSIAIVAAIGTIGWYAASMGMVDQKSENDQVNSMIRPVPTAIVQDAEMELFRQFPGTVQAQSRVEIAFSIDGKLVELNGREGLSVKKGEILAKIDERDFLYAYEAAKANHLRAKTELARVRTLQERKVISQSEYDDAKTAYDVAKAELQIRKKAFEDTVIVAPYDGVVAERYVENHEHVKKQAPILAFKDIAEIDVVIQVPERLIALKGAENFRELQVNFDADSKRWFAGQVKEYRVLSDPITRTYEVAVSVERPSDLNVLPGMTATVKVATAGTERSLADDRQVHLVPVEAVLGGNDGSSFVWIIPEAGGRPARAEVSLGALRNKDVEIIDGLQTGQCVAVSGVHSLREAMEVRPMRVGREGLDG